MVVVNLAAADAQLGLGEARAVVSVSVDDVVMSAFKAMKDHVRRQWLRD